MNYMFLHDSKALVAMSCVRDVPGLLCCVAHSSQDPMECILVMSGWRGKCFLSWILITRPFRWHSYCAFIWCPWECQLGAGDMKVWSDRFQVPNNSHCQRASFSRGITNAISGACAEESLAYSGKHHVPTLLEKSIHFITAILYYGMKWYDWLFW